METLESLDGLVARPLLLLAAPARLGALPGPPVGSAFPTPAPALLAGSNGLARPEGPAILDAACRLCGRIGTDLKEAVLPTAVLMASFAGFARVACGFALFSFCLFAAGPSTDEVEDIVDMENAVLAWDEPDAERSDGVTETAADTLRLLAFVPSAGVVARPSVEFVRGRFLLSALASSTLTISSN